MTPSDKKIRTQNWLLPLLVFLIFSIILSCMLYNEVVNNQARVRTLAELNAATYAERMTSELAQGIAVTDSLQGILISGDGHVRNFHQVAASFMTSSLQSIQLAPNGVVTDIYPEAGNEAGPIDLINDEKTRAISRYGRDNDLTIMQGPFPLLQGGTGIAVKNPVYLKDSNGEKYFWGFTIAIIRVPDIFADSAQALTDFGYEYRLSKTVSPLTPEYTEVYSSGAVLTDPAVYCFKVGCCSYKLEVMPSDGWNSDSQVPILFICGFFINLLLSSLIYAILILRERHETLKTLSVTDPLTGLLNRHGFDEAWTRFMKAHPETPCVGIQLDIDDFKFINDIYGHAAGDLALQELAGSLQRAFPENAILSRSGGDEFSVILTGTTCQDSVSRIEAFTFIPRSFKYSGTDHPFHISLGYAGYPKDSTDPSVLLKNADIALYEVKLRGKHSCLPYRQGFHSPKRHRLGFALRDISQNLPGAFLIYKADPQDDHILYANQELIRYAGCKDMDEFLTYSGHSFRGLIRPDEQALVEKSIWDQIHSKANGTNDYVQFHFVKKDGSCHPVLDHGRIVENTYFGTIFYVLIMDCALLDTHYNN